MGLIALITGIETGIGKATAIAFAEAGYDIGGTWAGSAASAELVAGTVRQHGMTCVMRRLDLSTPASGATVINELADELGGADVLVNNAAIGLTSSFLDTELADWIHVLNVNLTGSFCCAQAAARRMISSERAGAIVNVTSVQQNYPVVGSAAYGAAKGGLGQLTRVMAAELGRFGIRVNAVAPGEVNTAMNGREGVPGKNVVRQAVPLGRAGSAIEIAKVITWLASDSATFLTGATIVVDGGATLMGAQLATEGT